MVYMTSFKLKISLLLTIAVMMGSVASAAIPSGYYDNAQGKTQQALLTALETIVNNGKSAQSYAAVWTAFRTTDADSNGKLIDMYSNKLWTYSNDQCGSYSNVGDCYNREHSMPKSWFGGSTSAGPGTDLFHMYPTDGKVNGQRSAYPFGECANGTRLTNGSYVGKGKLGTCTYSGGSGTVFEPDDEYKGDFARTYFYMVTAYNSKQTSWTSSGTNLSGNKYPCFNTWSLNMLLEWHRNDPVSEKETKRNDAVYAIQKNRNPYIDHPELVEYVWGDNKNDAAGWQGTASTTPTLSAPTAGSTVSVGTTTANTAITKSVTIAGSNLTSAITLSLSGTNSGLFALSTTSVSASAANSGTTVTVTYTPTANGTHTATLTLSSSDFSTRTVTLTGTASDSGSGGGDSGSGAYVKVTTDDDIAAGDEILIVYEGSTNGPVILNGSLGNDMDNNKNGLSVTIDNETIEATTEVTAAAFILEDSSDSGYYYIKSKGGYYIGSTSTSSNTLLRSTTDKYNNSIAFSSGNAIILGGRVMRFNNATNTERFRYYSGTTQQPVAIYKKQAGGSSEPEPDPTLTVSPSSASLTATAGTASEPEEIIIDSENNSSDITVSVPSSSVFELSTDQSTWASQLTIDPEGETVFVRVKASATAGNATATLTATVGTLSATCALSATVSEPAAIDTPVATPATDVTDSGFTANWQELTGADGYELHVYTQTSSGSASTETSTLTFTSSCGGSGTADDGAEWTVTSDGAESSYDSTKGIHYGTSSNAVQYIQLATSDISGTISQVVVNASTASGVSATASVTVGGTAFTCNNSETASLSSTATEYTFTGSGTGKIIVRIEKPSSATKAIYAKSVAVTYTTGGGSTTTEITGSPFAINSVSTTSYAVTGLEAETTYHYYVYGKQGGTVATAQSNVIDVPTTATPTLAVAPATLSFSATEGTASAAQSVAITATNNSSAIGVALSGTGASAFELSTDQTTWSSSLSGISATGGTIYARVKASASAGSTYYANLTATAGSLSATCELSATVTAESTDMVFEKITSLSSLVLGRKILIVYEEGNLTFNGNLPTLDATSNMLAVSIDNNTITPENDLVKNATFTLEESNTSGKYYILSNSGFYIGQTSDANGLKSSATSGFDNDISFDEDGNANIVSGDAHLRYNAASGNFRFRYYKSSTYTQQKAIAIYQERVSTTPTTLGEAVGTSSIDLPVNIAYVDGNGIAYGCASAGENQITEGNASEKSANAGTYSDDFTKYDQRDWVAISGLTNPSQYLGKTISGFKGSRDSSKPGYYYVATSQPTSVAAQSGDNNVPTNEYQVHNLVASPDDNDYVRPQVYEYTTKFYASLKKQQNGTWKAFGTSAGNDVSILLDTSLFASTTGWVESSGTNYNTLEGIFVTTSGASSSPRLREVDLGSQSYQFLITKAPTSEDIPTGINGIGNDNETMKVRGIYNLQGQRVRATVPGQLYIINGKKTMVNSVIRDTDF